MSSNLIWSRILTCYSSHFIAGGIERDDFINFTGNGRNHLKFINVLNTSWYNNKNIEANQFIK